MNYNAASNLCDYLRGKWKQIVSSTIIGIRYMGVSQIQIGKETTVHFSPGEDKKANEYIRKIRFVHSGIYVECVAYSGVSVCEDETHISFHSDYYRCIDQFDKVTFDWRLEKPPSFIRVPLLRARLIGEPILVKRINKEYLAFHRFCIPSKRLQLLIAVVQNSEGDLVQFLAEKILRRNAAPYNLHCIMEAIQQRCSTDVLAAVAEILIYQRPVESFEYLNQRHSMPLLALCYPNKSI